MNPLDPDKAIIDRLLDAAAVTAITSNLSVNQVPPPEELPYVVIAQDDGTTERYLDGGAGLDQHSVVLECCAADMIQAKALAKACKDALDGQSWDLLDDADQVVGRVQGAFCEGTDDDYVPRSENDEETIEIVTFQVELFIGD